MPTENTCILTFFSRVESILSFSHYIYNFQMLADLALALGGRSDKGLLPACLPPSVSLPDFLRKGRSDSLWNTLGREFGFLSVTGGMREKKKASRNLQEFRKSENHFTLQLNTDYFVMGMSHLPSLKQDLKKFLIIHYVSFRMSTNSHDFSCSHLCLSPGQWW